MFTQAFGDESQTGNKSKQLSWNLENFPTKKSGNFVFMKCWELCAYESELVACCLSQTGYYLPVVGNSVTACSSVVERGSSVVEWRTRHGESTCSNPPFATVSKFGHFRPLHDASVHPAV